MTIERGRLDFNLGFQRDGVWMPSDRSLLIDSIVRNYPIPAIFLYKSQVGRDPVYYVLDGKQRLESILRFVGAMRGRFEALAEFPGAAARAERITWQTLNKREQQYRLLDYRMQIIEVEGEWS